MSAVGSASQVAAILRKTMSAGGAVVALTHLRADADAWGSLFGLARLIGAAGGRVVPVSGEPTPARYARIGAVVAVVEPAAVPSPVEAPVAVVMDTPTAERVTPGGADALAGRRVIQIDHHASGRPFGDLSWVDPRAPATAEMILRLADAAGWSVDPQAAAWLYTGLAGDTGGFRYRNTTAAALSAAARLAELGADVAEIGCRLLDTRSRASLELQRLAHERATWRCGDTVVGTWIDRADYAALNASPEDSDGIVEGLRAVDGVRIAIFVDRSEQGEPARISWRTHEMDATALARRFGGGGHPGAAGAEAEGTPRKVLETAMGEAESAAAECPGCDGEPGAAPDEGR